jgi:hypothetical protein
MSRFFSRFGARYNFDETPKYFPGDPEPLVGTWFNPANTEAADPRMEPVDDRVPLILIQVLKERQDDFNAWIPGTTANSGAEAGSSFSIGPNGIPEPIKMCRGIQTALLFRLPMVPSARFNPRSRPGSCVGSQPAG